MEISTTNGRVFWIHETIGDRTIDHFCHLQDIPVVAEFNPESKKTYRHFWSGAWLRIPKHEMNDMFEANQIDFRFVK